MRRKDREVTDLNKVFEIVHNCSVAHVGMVENGKPYVVALNFGYERQGGALILYFHSAYEGHKMIFISIIENYAKRDKSGGTIGSITDC